MNRLNRVRAFIQKMLPYVLCILGGTSLFFASKFAADEDIKSLTINISAALIAVPVVFVLYEREQKITQKNLNKELFEYAKMKSDKEIMHVVSQLMKIAYDYEVYDLSPKSWHAFLSLDKENIKSLLIKKKFLGFQIFKTWQVSEKNFEELVQHSFVFKAFEDEQIITIIEILKKIGTLQYVLEKYDLFVETKQINSTFTVVSGAELNSENVTFPNRYLLLRELKNGRHQVQDFGDFSAVNREKFLKVYTINPEFADALSQDIFELNEIFVKWLNLTGNEIIFDPRSMRIISRA